MADELPEGSDKVILRVPPDEQELLKRARMVVAKSGRKVIDTRIFLVALRRLKIDQSFIAAFDAHGEKEIPTVEGGHPRVNVRIPEREFLLLQKARTFLVKEDRRANDTRIFLVALQGLKLDAEFLEMYDDLRTRDRRVFRKTAR